MDFSDKATLHEEMLRDIALNNARCHATRDYEAELCNGCGYATRASWGKTCDGWRECLEDLQKRERSCRG